MIRTALVFLAGSLYGLYLWSLLAHRLFPESTSATRTTGAPVTYHHV